MKKLLFIPLLFLSLTTMAACSPDDVPVPPTEQPSTPEEPGDEGNPDDSENPANPDEPDTPSGNGNMLVVYFSAEGHTQAVAERIVELTGADIHRIELPNRMPQILTMTATASSVKPTTTCVPEWRTCLMRKRLRNTIRFSSVRLVGGINPRW